MSEIKHTPGPWHIHDGTIPDGENESKWTGTFDIINRVAYEEGVKVIADTKPYGGNYPNREEAHANAKIISVAPDMFEIIKELYEFSMSTGLRGLIFPKLDAVMTKINS